MASQWMRWMQHGACIGLMMLIGTACAAGPGLPAAAKPASAVQQPATGQQATTVSQKPAASKATQAKQSDSSGEQPKSVDLCALVTTDEMSGIIGALKGAPTALKGPAGEMLMCTFTAASGQEVSFQNENVLSWGTIKGVSKMDKADESVDGFGKEALFGPASGDGIYVLSILTDRMVLHISVKGAADRAQALTLAEAVASKALPRI